MVDKPDVRAVWANNGEKTNPGESKLDLGWVAEIPTHQNFNWLQNRISAFQAHVNERGIPDWDANTSYLDGAFVRFEGQLWISNLTENLNRNPNEWPGYWEKYADHVANQVVASISTDVGLTGDGSSVSPLTMDVPSLTVNDSATLSAQDSLIYFDEAQQLHKSIKLENLTVYFEQTIGGNTGGQLLGAVDIDAPTSNSGYNFVIPIEVPTDGTYLTIFVSLVENGFQTTDSGNSLVTINLDSTLILERTGTPWQFISGEDDIVILATAINLDTSILHQLETAGSYVLTTYVKPRYGRPVTGSIQVYSNG